MFYMQHEFNSLLFSPMKADLCIFWNSIINNIVIIIEVWWLWPIWSFFVFASWKVCDTMITQTKFLQFKLKLMHSLYVQSQIWSRWRTDHDQQLTGTLLPLFSPVQFWQLNSYPKRVCSPSSPYVYLTFEKILSFQISNEINSKTHPLMLVMSQPLSISSHDPWNSLWSRSQPCFSLI